MRVGNLELMKLPSGQLSRYDHGKGVLIDPPFGPLPEGSVSYATATAKTVVEQQRRGR